MNNYIDEKVTVVKRYHFTDGTDMAALIKRIDEGGVYEVLEEESGFLKTETLDETEMPVDPSEFMPSIEVYAGNKMIWDNEPKN